VKLCGVLLSGIQGKKGLFQVTKGPFQPSKRSQNAHKGGRGLPILARGKMLTRLTLHNFSLKGLPAASSASQFLPKSPISASSCFLLLAPRLPCVSSFPSSAVVYWSFFGAGYRFLSFSSCTESDSLVPERATTLLFGPHLSRIKPR